MSMTLSMQTLQTISTISFIVMVCALLALACIGAKARVPRSKEYTHAVESLPTLPPIGTIPKGHRKPSADVRRTMGIMSALDRGTPASYVAANYGYGSVSQMEKVIKKNRKRARAELSREGVV
jgi:hypothetical protein